MNPPTLETAAAAEPEMEPNSIQVSVLTYDSPPGKRPTSALAKSISRRAIPPRPIRMPERTKNGIASREKELTPLTMRSATISSGAAIPPFANTAASDAAPIATATGTLQTSRTKNTIMRTSATSVIVFPPFSEIPVSKRRVQIPE